MAIEVTQIIGDTVELVFNPAEEDLHVGENLSVRGRHEDRGLIVQVIDIRAVFSAFSLSGGDQQPSVGARIATQVVANAPVRSPRRRKAPQPTADGHGLYLAIAKIRKMTDPAWRPWDGWLPTSTVVVAKTADDELLRQCIPDLGTPLWLGKTVAGEPFYIERAALGGLNLIAGIEGSGTTHLAQVLISQLIEHGLPCIVFDSKGVYARLAEERASSLTSAGLRHAIVPLMVGESLKLTMTDMNPDTFSTMLRHFGLPTVAALYFASHVTRRFSWLKSHQDVDQPPPFVGIDDLIQLARDLEAEGQPVVGGAILGCLDAIKQARIFATQPREGTALHDGYAAIRRGGALVIDLSKLARYVRSSVVSALVGSLSDISVRASAPEADRLVCLFFDEAQTLVRRYFITDVLLPLSHLGLSSFFVTSRAVSFGDHLEHDTDNLFLCQVTSDDARHLARRSRVDAATLQNVGRRLNAPHSLLVGKATGEFPIIFAIEPLDSIGDPGERAPFAHVPATPPMTPGTRERPRFAPRRPAPVKLEPSLPLFPDATPPLTAAQEAGNDETLAAMPTSATPTLERVIAMWGQVVKRVARRRRILETILAAAHPLRLTERGLVLSFPPQQRFQQELVESDEYRSLLEEEIEKVFGVSLEVTTEVYPA